MSSSHHPALRPARSSALDGNTYSIERRFVAPALQRTVDAEMTLKTRGFKGDTTIFRLDSSDATTIRVPRLYGISRFGPPASVAVSNGSQFRAAAYGRLGATSVPAAPHPGAGVRSAYTLLPYQQRCIEYIFSTHYSSDRQRDHSEGCVVDLPCGMGKTLVGIEFIRRIDRKALVICHPSGVSVRQWALAFQRFLPSLITSEHHGGAVPPDADVVVTTINSVVLGIGSGANVAYNRWLCGRGSVVYDEAHLLSSTKFGTVIGRIFAQYQLGLSATLERSDRKHELVLYAIGPSIDAVTTLGVSPPKFDVLVRVLMIRPTPACSGGMPIAPGSAPPTASAAVVGLPSHMASLKELTLSESRIMDLISRLDARLVERSDECILVFCNFIEECDVVSDALRRHAWSGASGVTSALVSTVYRDLDAADVRHAADVARIIVCTYKKAGTGFSPVRFTTGVIWSSTKRLLVQGCGRLTRWNDDDPTWNTRQRLILDYSDVGTVAEAQCWHDSLDNGMLIPARVTAYERLGYRVEVERAPGSRARGPKRPTPARGRGRGRGGRKGADAISSTPPTAPAPPSTARRSAGVDYMAEAIALVAQLGLEVR